MYRVIVLLILVLLLSEAMARSSSRGRSYRRSSRTSYRSGSRSTGTCTSGTSTCVIIPIVCVVGFFVLIFAIVMIAHCIKAAEKRQKEQLAEKRRMEKIRKDEMEKRQKEEASRLEKLQKEQEEQMKNQLFMNQTDYSANPQPQAQFVMPGTAVQPTYQVVNPYAGNHNYQPVPVFYDPAAYGVQYDENWQTPEQNMLYTPIAPFAGTNDSAKQDFNANSVKVAPYEGNETAAKLV
ncbi:unnamed protein product [Moneuplotes crassus]|uniref:Uncharacterized protein n=1 Tax=Euplotes crassus TaxID=5936 RepID=A0AAD2D290_EUPCR|nr:unnamed protein product [Moneuplotes crassus]